MYAPGEFRPVSDHTKSGFNPACIGDIYAHVLATHRDVAHFLQSGYVMLVSDVDGAFPILPLAPWLWPFMLFLVPLIKSAGRRARRRVGALKLPSDGADVRVQRWQGVLR